MYRITKTFFRPAETVPYFASVAPEQEIVVNRLTVARKAAPGFVSIVVHRTSPTTLVKIETWETAAQYTAFYAQNAADCTFVQTLGLNHQVASNIKVSVFAETI